jgi:hypothetical protein
VPSKRTLAKQAEIEAAGISPLDFMLRIMRDEGQDMDRRCDMAKAAGPYVHAKLSSVDAKLEIDGQLVININKPA